jgi:hypothetical protein
MFHSNAAIVSLFFVFDRARSRLLKTKKCDRTFRKIDQSHRFSKPTFCRCASYNNKAVAIANHFNLLSHCIKNETHRIYAGVYSTARLNLVKLLFS